MEMKTDKGRPGIVSPAFAEKLVKKEAAGYMQMARYADDSIMSFRRKEDAEAFVRVNSWLTALF
jgi:hypothetical protein